MKVLLILLSVSGLTACANNSAGPAASSSKQVDSAVSAAPDTIKAIALDSVKRMGVDSRERDSAERVLAAERSAVDTGKR